MGVVRVTLDSLPPLAHTRALLFKGANPQASQRTLQSIGGMNGFLDDGCCGNEDSHPPPPPAAAPPPSFTPCPHPTLQSVQCTDCDKRICVANCSRYCYVCGYIFCQYCSVLK